MKKLSYSILFLFSGFIMTAQSVTKPLFERGIDYINCQITKVSLKDQPGQIHLNSFNDEIGNHNCSFEKVVEFLKTRETGVMTKNLELSFFINSYKNKFDPTLSDAGLYSILTTDLLKEAPIQSFKINHETSFTTFETLINQYLITLFRLNDTSTETIEDGMGEVVMVEEGEDELTTEPTPVSPPVTPKEQTQEKVTPEIVNPPVEDYSPFNFDEGDELFSFSSWLFRFSLLFATLALLLWVLLPYYEKREKAKVKQQGEEVHPMALSLEAEVSILENNNRILREKIRKLHMDLDDYEDTFKSI